MTHELKILPKWFEDVNSEKKTFEIRKNDRNFKVGDTLILKEYYAGEYTGRELKCKVSYIFNGDGDYGVSKGFVIMAISKVREAKEWIDYQEDKWIYAKCPVCGSVRNTKTPYCPICGTDMRGDINAGGRRR